MPGVCGQCERSEGGLRLEVNRSIPVGMTVCRVDFETVTGQIQDVEYEITLQRE